MFAQARALEAQGAYDSLVQKIPLVGSVWFTALGGLLILLVGLLVYKSFSKRGGGGGQGMGGMGQMKALKVFAGIALLMNIPVFLRAVTWASDAVASTATSMLDDTPSGGDIIAPAEGGNGGAEAGGG